MVELPTDQNSLKILLYRRIQTGIDFFCFRFETRRSNTDFVRDH